MLDGIYNVVRDSRVRRDWRQLTFRRISKFFQPRIRALDWWKDPWFASFLETFGESNGPHAGNRWNLYQLTRSIADVPGDTAECGVFEGAGSYLICSATGCATRTHHLFDSFAGLSEPTAGDGNFWKPGDLASTMETAQKNLRGFRVNWHPGWIPEHFREVQDSRFAFVHVDVDLEEPTRASMEFFYPRLNQGAILLCDDYGFSACPGATKAVDEFLADKAEKLVALASGGGFIIKR